MMNKKAQIVADLLVFIVVVLVVVVIFGFFGWGMLQFSNVFSHIPTTANPLNISVANEANKIVPAFNQTVGMLKFIGLCIVFGMILSFLVSLYFVRSNPVFFVAYLLLSIIAIIVAIVISMAYTNIIKEPFASSVLTQDVAGTFILQYLPFWITVLAFIGGILLFSGMNKENAGGGGF